MGSGGSRLHALRAGVGLHGVWALRVRDGGLAPARPLRRAIQHAEQPVRLPPGRAGQEVSTPHPTQPNPEPAASTSRVLLTVAPLLARYLQTRRAAVAMESVVFDKEIREGEWDVHQEENQFKYGRTPLLRVRAWHSCPPAGRDGCLRCRILSASGSMPDRRSRRRSSKRLEVPATLRVLADACVPSCY